SGHSAAQLECAPRAKRLATAASLLIATVRSSRLQAVRGRADVWPFQHLQPEAMPDRVIQPAPEATLDPNRCVRRRRDRLRRNPSPRHAATRPSDPSAARPEGRAHFAVVGEADNQLVNDTILTDGARQRFDFNVVRPMANEMIAIEALHL